MEVESILWLSHFLSDGLGGIGMGLGPGGQPIDANHLNKGIGMGNLGPAGEKYSVPLDWGFLGKLVILIFGMIGHWVVQVEWGSYPYLFVIHFNWASLVTQTVKNPPAVQETWVRSLGQKDILEKEMATRSSTLGWKIPWTEEPGRLQSKGLQRVGHGWATSLSLLSRLKEYPKVSK